MKGAEAPTSAIVLAAGRGTRFGGGKLTALVHGEPVIRRTVRSIQEGGVRDVIVVLGHDAENVRNALADLPVRFAGNERFEEGMGSSVAAGIAALGAEAAAVMVALGDQPLDPAIVTGLLDAASTAVTPIVRPIYAGTPGNPVLFRAALFSALLRLTGDEGARQLIANNPDLVTTVPFDFPPPPDLDTLHDLSVLEG
jgi:molybdenum cofactor cytidylyltransferase